MGHGAEMNGCGKCLKYLMFTFNFLALVGGIAVMAVGIWTCIDHLYFEQLLGTNLYLSATVILIATGVVVMLISFLGCFGAVKEIKCMLLTYFIVMFGIFVTMLVGGILGYAFRAGVSMSMRTRMYSSLNEYGHSNSVTKAWDYTQSILHCCGVEGADGYKIWMRENRMFNTSLQVPLSCCLKADKSQTGTFTRGFDGKSYVACQTSPTKDNAYLDGCLTKAVEAVQNQSSVIGGVGVGVAFVMLLGMIFSMALFKMIR